MKTRQELMELLHYDPQSGVFTWRTPGSNNNRWKNRVGKIAGYGGTKNNQYLRVLIDHQSYSLHRLAWLFVYGSWPEDQLDHIDRNKTNNAISNLRSATNRQNSANKDTEARGVSGFKGVTFRKGRYIAQYRKKHLGCFASPDMAHLAYVEAVNGHAGGYSPWKD